MPPAKSLMSVKPQVMLSDTARMSGRADNDPHGTEAASTGTGQGGRVDGDQTQSGEGLRGCPSGIRGTSSSTSATD